MHPKTVDPPGGLGAGIGAPSDRGRRWASRAGVAAGLAIAVLAVASWRVPRGNGTLGADVQVVTMATGPLDLHPVGLVVGATDLRPGRSSSGTITVRNLTGRTQAVRIAATASAPDLDDVLSVRVTTGRSVLYAGPLGGLRDGTSGVLRLVSGQRATVSIALSLPPGTPGGYVGRIETVTLRWDTRPV